MRQRGIRCVVDTNIFVSAAIAGGRPGRVVELIYEKEIELVTSEGILNEFSGVIALKFPTLDADLKTVVEDLRSLAIVVEPEDVRDVIEGEALDNEVLSIALMSKAQFIISGDKRHLLALGQIEGIPIVSAKEFLVQFWSQ